MPRIDSFTSGKILKSINKRLEEMDIKALF